MKFGNEMALFKIIIDRDYKDILLTNLAEFKLAHMREKGEYQSKIKTEEEDIFKNKLKNLRLNLEMLLKKLDITELDFQALNIKKEEKINFVAKDSNDLINYFFEEINFYTNRFNELERYTSTTKIELEKINNLEKTYHFLENYGISRENLSNLAYLDFKIYTTYSKNMSILNNIFEFSEFPCVIHTQTISNDRTAFFIIYPKENENQLKEKISVIHGEVVPLLKKFLTKSGINFKRINNELELIKNYLKKYENELTRIRDNNLLKFAAIEEGISNLEEYSWVSNQFEELSLNRLSYKFFVLQSKKEELKNQLKNIFHDKITFEVLNISKRGVITKDQDNEEKVLKEKTKKRGSKKKHKDKGESKEKLDYDLEGETPTLMMHNRLIRPFETLTKMYGTPSYSEVDPTAFLFITFPLIFGIMFGDIGHGMVLIISGIVGGILFRKREGDLRNFCWIIFWCGWWAIFGGFLYGEFFGSEEIFGYPLKPIPIPIPFIGVINLYDPLNNVMAIFFLTISIGVIHLNLGWLIQFINFWKSSKKYSALTETLMKVLFLDAGIFLIAKWGVDLRTWLASPFPPILLPIIPAILLILFKPLGKMLGISYFKKESYMGLIGKGSLDTFETVLSVLSNVLSYIRMLALALAHVSLLLAITAMVSIIPGQSIFVQIIVTIALVFGNIIVILLEGILVFINAIRLHFYEFFFKFYEGRGKAFIPFILEEKYSNISFKRDTEKDLISTEIEREIETEETRENIEDARNYISAKYF
ncbi:MAG: V-type ATP synthase subunit I [Promethearchaeota archaeon]